MITLTINNMNMNMSMSNMTYAMISTYVNRQSLNRSTKRNVRVVALQKQHQKCEQISGKMMEEANVR
jgi:hypothetical protein